MRAHRLLIIASFLGSALGLGGCSADTDADRTKGADSEMITPPSTSERRVNPHDPKDGEEIIADGKLFRYGDYFSDPSSELAIVAGTPIEINQGIADTVGVDLPPEGESWGLYGYSLRASGKVENYVDYLGRPRTRFVSVDQILVCPKWRTTLDCAELTEEQLRLGPVCEPANRSWLESCENVTVVN